MTFASPRARFGLPCTQPASCVCTALRALFNTAPFSATSNCEYWLRDTPPALGVWIFTCGKPFAVWSTIGCWLPGADLSARIAISSAWTEGKKTKPNANIKLKWIGLSESAVENNPVFSCSELTFSLCALPWDFANSETTTSWFNTRLKITL